MRFRAGAEVHFLYEPPGPTDVTYCNNQVPAPNEWNKPGTSRMGVAEVRRFRAIMPKVQFTTRRNKRGYKGTRQSSVKLITSLSQ